MKKKIEQLLTGKFEYEQPKLLFTQEKIEIHLKPGEMKRGEIFIGTNENKTIKGYVVSSDRRLMTKNDKISGTGICIQYGADAKGMYPGDVVEGKLQFITNLGEYDLPFEIIAEKEALKTTSREIKNIDDFVDSAKNNFHEAYRLFAGKNLYQILKPDDMRERALYEGMVQNPVTYHNLDEFLIGMEQKQPALFSLRQKEKELYELKESVKESVVLKKNGWGYFRVDVEIQGSFIEVNKKVITAEDFIGSYYELEYVINKNKLNHNVQNGRIILKSPYQTEVYNIIVSQGKKVDTGINIEEKKHKISLMKKYIDYRLERLSFDDWIKESQDELFHMIEDGFDYPEYQFYRAYLFYMEADIETAREIIWRYQNRIFDRSEIELAGVFLWLCVLTGLYKDKEKALQKIQNLYMQREDSLILFMILLQMDEKFAADKQQVMFMLEEIYEKGCSSPLLYLEVWNILVNEPEMLRRIDQLWTQVFLFAEKQNILTEELAIHFAYLSKYQKSFRRSLYKALAIIADRYPSPDTLEAICKYIVKDDPRKKEYFKWFSKAVEQGMRLVRLYEYYVESMDISYQRELPKSLLVYFSYNNDVLSDDKKAFLYASIIGNKEQEKKTYLSYEDTMKQFAKHKIQEGRIDDNYALLYQEFLSKPETEEDAYYMAEKAFTVRLFCDDPSIRYVIVRHGQMNAESIYPCIKGVAYPRVYTEDAVFIFQDELQRRYTSTVNYNYKKLLDERNMVSDLLLHYAEDAGMLLYYCENYEITEENIWIFQKASMKSVFTEDYRKKLCKRILDYLYANRDDDSIQTMLLNMNYTEYAKVDRKKLIDILIFRGIFEPVMEVVREYGYEGIETKELLKLASRVLENTEKRDEDLLDLARFVYKEGFYDEPILKYLIKYAIGPAEYLFSLWESAKGFEMDTYELEERILTELMFVSDYRKDGEAVLESYLKQSGKEWIVGAYLTMIAYHHFIKEEEISPFLRKSLEKAWKQKWPVNQVCHLTLLKSITEDDEISHEDMSVANKILKKSLENGLIFSFFKKLPVELLSPYQLDDKTCVEYHANPKAKVTLYYCLDSGLDENKEYISEPLRNIYQGIFTKTFTLFYGEVLRYYFKIEEEDNIFQTEEAEITMQETEGNSTSKYQLLNQILSARKLENVQEVRNKMKQYLRQEQYVRKMFTIRKKL